MAIGPLDIPAGHSIWRSTRNPKLLCTNMFTLQSYG